MSADPALRGAATAPHVKVHPRDVRGPWRRLRWGVSLMLQALLFLGPWLRWDGHPALLLDLPGRRVHLFSVVLGPQDLPLLLLLLIILALTLFVSTALAGRMWCGYACPQTVLADVFILSERLLEGDRAARLALDAAPWTPRRLLLRGVKGLLWGAMSMVLGFTVVAWFHGGPELVALVRTGTAPAGALVGMGVCAGLALLDLGWFRERLCHHVCPYARFQGALLDDDSLVVAYDARRGEPRGRPRETGTGDCIDCGLCVQVCPMGIDIRRGLQLECIACTACIDACDGVMQRLKRPRGLVRYTSLNLLEGRPGRILRPRTFIYGSLLLALACAGAWSLLARQPLFVDVTRDAANSAFVVTADGQVMNAYAVRVVNRSRHPRRLEVGTRGLEGGRLVLSPQNPLDLAADSDLVVRALVLRPRASVSACRAFHFVVTDASEPAVRLESATTFVGPGSR